MIPFITLHIIEARFEVITRVVFPFEQKKGNGVVRRPYAFNGTIVVTTITSFYLVTPRYSRSGRSHQVNTTYYTSLGDTNIGSNFYGDSTGDQIEFRRVSISDDDLIIAFSYLERNTMHNQMYKQSI